MRYVPAGAVGERVTDPPAVPPEILHGALAMTPAIGAIVQLASFPLNPKPETPTVVPGKATFGVTVTSAEGVPSWNAVWAENVPSPTVITYVPAPAPTLTVNPPDACPVPPLNTQLTVAVSEGRVAVAVGQIPVAVELNPCPLSETVVPDVPVDGVRVMLGMTLKAAVTISVPGLPVTVIV